MKNLLLIAITSVAMSSAHALDLDPEFYAGANYSTFQLSQTSPNVDASFSVYTLEGLAGVALTENIAIEARAGAGLNRDRVEVNGQTREVAAQYYGSLYFRPYLNNEKAGLYGLLGVSAISFDAEPKNVDGEDTQVGLALGGGVSFVTGPNSDFVIEWKQLLNSDAMTMRGVSAGFTYSF